MNRSGPIITPTPPPPPPPPSLKILVELSGDKNLERFRIEYEKLHRALKKSHESEKRLMQKCRELNAEIVANTAKVTTVLKMSQEDKNSISSLKQVFICRSISFTPHIHTHTRVHTHTHIYIFYIYSPHTSPLFAFFCTGN